MREVKIQLIKYVQRHLASLLRLAVDNHCPIVWDIERKTLVKDLLIVPSKEFLEPVLNFDRTASGMKYRLQFRQNDKLWNIHEKEVIPFTNDPAWLFVKL